MGSRRVPIPTPLSTYTPRPVMSSSEDSSKGATPRRWKIPSLFRPGPSRESSNEKSGPSKWSLGVLNDKETVEVPGSVLLLASDRNEPLGLRNVNARTSHSSIPIGFPLDVPTTPGGTRIKPDSHLHPDPQQSDPVEDKKTTSDGNIILEPQPEESANDPLNWPAWRRDVALLSLGFYCMIGGGITPLIAAGFTDVARDYDVSVETVSLTTGLYMMGLGMGSVIASPTAILFGKRPVYLVSAIVFIGTCLWAAWSPSFSSLLAARVFQGVAISPVECLPSATIAEIFFLHERAYRIGIYTLLLLGGKNLVPLVSAAIIGSFGWRWVFWIVAMVVGLGFILLFLFVPETFWDRTPTRKPSKRPSFLRRLSSRHHAPTTATPSGHEDAVRRPSSPGIEERNTNLHVGFAPVASADQSLQQPTATVETPAISHTSARHVGWAEARAEGEEQGKHEATSPPDNQQPEGHHEAGPTANSPPTMSAANIPTIQLPEHEISVLDSIDSPRHTLSPTASIRRTSHLQHESSPYSHSATGSEANVGYSAHGPNLDPENIPASKLRAPLKVQEYTHNLRQLPPQTFTQQLKPYHGRLNNDNWFKVMVRPFVLFAYPAVLWSAAVYACSIGWLIVISETMAIIYRDPTVYNFSALQTGLVYVSPFVGGILGTGVAGKVSDIIVRAMARRNGGLYEPEFRLIMAGPILITTVMGLMGFGWSAQEKDHWIVPTLFFGILSFGCSLGSTTSITYCVDSYRQYAGEALVTLNFSKNVLHGLVFSLFVAHWMAEDGPKMVFIWLGVIQLILQLFTIPLYIYGKRARMWTVRQNFMEKL
ncbi:MFS transporter [Purpureocillium lilacinum]|uniref:MFS transporter n=1 Tax=Purpureocillium lilacinum TaxID=33203 RepID=A0A179HAB3_PURLI|nr:MFS transporter [Purpureocillium lilacinum]